MKRSGALKKESAKTKARKGERAQVKQAALDRANNDCEARLLVMSTPCFGPLDAHERLPRSRGGDAYDLANVLCVCRGHHEWIHGHPREAKELDLLE